MCIKEFLKAIEYIKNAWEEKKETERNETVSMWHREKKNLLRCWIQTALWFAGCFWFTFIKFGTIYISFLIGIWIFSPDVWDIRRIKWQYDYYQIGIYSADCHHLIFFFFFKIHDKIHYFPQQQSIQSRLRVSLIEIGSKKGEFLTDSYLLIMFSSFNLQIDLVSLKTFFSNFPFLSFPLFVPPTCQHWFGIPVVFIWIRKKTVILSQKGMIKKW